MAKGQKKSNREVRKPKKETPKVIAAAPSFLNPAQKAAAARRNRPRHQVAGCGASGARWYCIRRVC